MGGQSMKYEDLYDEFINLFPEDKEFFKRLEEETGVERSIGMHIMFGLVVSPYILRLLEKEPEKAKKAFEFIEKMETSEDERIANVADVSVLEILITEEDGGIEKIRKYLGPKSLASVSHSAQYFNL